MNAPAIAAIVLLLSASLASAQDSGHAAARRVLLVVAPETDAAFTAGDALLIARSLQQRLQEADPQIIVVEGAEESAGGPRADLRAAAKKAGADAWLTVSLGGGWTGARLAVRAFDLVSKTEAANLKVTRASLGSPGGLPQETWTDITEALVGKFLPADAAVPGPDAVQTARLTVSAMPGSVITGLGSSPLKVGQGGRASRVLPLSREYVLRTALAGYVPVTQRVFLSADRTVDVRQEESARWAFEVSLADSRAPGFDVTFAEPRISSFLRFGFSTYALGLALSSTDILLNLPLTVVSVQAGSYLFPEDGFLRLYLAGSAFARVVHAAGTVPVLDQLAPIGLRAVFGAELPASPRSRLYLEYTPSIYQTSVPDALHAALGPENAPGWFFGQTAALNILSFRVGYRWQP